MLAAVKRRQLVSNWSRLEPTVTERKQSLIVARFFTASDRFEQFETKTDRFGKCFNSVLESGAAAAARVVILMSARAVTDSFAANRPCKFQYY